MRDPGTGDAAAAAGRDRAEPALSWGPARATATPASAATVATPATAHTHRGGRGQPPNSVTPSDGTAHLAPIVSGGSRSMKNDLGGDGG
jgi:hypothetical protein